LIQWHHRERLLRLLELAIIRASIHSQTASLSDKLFRDYIDLLFPEMASSQEDADRRAARILSDLRGVVFQIRKTETGVDMAIQTEPVRLDDD